MKGLKNIQRHQAKWFIEQLLKNIDKAWQIWSYKGESNILDQIYWRYPFGGLLHGSGQLDGLDPVGPLQRLRQLKARLISSVADPFHFGQPDPEMKQKNSKNHGEFTQKSTKITRTLYIFQKY